MAASGPIPAPAKRDFLLFKILAQLGLLVVPTTIIAIFCQVLDVSPQVTGIISLGVILVVGVCIYRKFINHYVPSALLTALLIGLGMVFFLNYQHILLKKTGLIKYYAQSNDFLSEVDSHISQSQQEIWFYGVDFNISATQRRDLLLSKLENGIKVRYLIFNPKSTHIADLAKDFDQPENALRSELEKGLNNLLDLRKHWIERAASSAHPGELDIRIFETPPHFRLYVFDPGRPRGSTYFIPYAGSVSSTMLPGYLLENVDNGVYKAYFNAIRKSWTVGTTLDEYLKSHPEIVVP